MTIVSHKYKTIFLKTMKTAGSSVEAALVKVCDTKDWVATGSDLEPLDHSFFHTPNRTVSALPRERGLKRKISRVYVPPAWRLYQHSSAIDVKRNVGAAIWAEYYKITVERNPWDRMLSLWRWRNPTGALSFEEFLGGIEAGHEDHGLKGRESSWSNWPIYTIGDNIVADKVIIYSILEEDIERAFKSQGIPVVDPLPKLKAGHRHPTDEIGKLTDDQIDRIGKLHLREVEAFGFTPY